MRLKGKNAQFFRRQTIVRLTTEGYTQQQISSLLQVAQSYVSDVLAAFRTHGESGLQGSTAKGAAPRLTAEQKQQLQTMLDAGAEAYGFEGALWTAKRVRQVIEEAFQVAYSQRQVQRILAQLGYTRQKPSTIEIQQDPKAVALWKEATLPELKKKRNKKSV